MGRRKQDICCDTKYPDVPAPASAWGANRLSMLTAEECTAARAENAVLAKQALQFVNALPHRPRFVLTHRFGLEGHAARTQRQVASDLGVSRSCVSRLEHRALQELRSLLQIDIQSTY